MKVSRKESITQPYVLTSHDLEKFCARTNGWFFKFDFEVTCKDKLNREFSTLEELLEFENSRAKDIQTLRVFGISKDTQTHLWLKFDKDLMRNIFISLEGNEDTVDGVNEAIEDSLSMMKPWYAVIARAESWLVFSFVLFLVFASISLFGFAAGRWRLSDLGNAKIIVLLITALIAGMVSDIVLTKLRLLIFPMGVFAIGQGLKRHKDKELIRTGVILAFVVSLASSLVAAFILALRG